MSENRVTTEEIAELVERNREAAGAYINGNMRRYLELVRASEDYTLMSPFGGDTVHGSDESDEAVEATSQFFRGGDADLEIEQTYASGQMVVLVGVERQHGEVGGLPDQDWSLRVTLVFRREGSQWWLVHRHADPLVHGIDMKQLSALARGRDPD
ncbi:YybH family protein [Kocuria sp. NPDC057446]|uniref:YybH family protein n=1 Tax=Kocuria sp. NPDC057446 TaxID=3346137 RepID=UPI0036CAE147